MPALPLTMQKARLAPASGVRSRSEVALRETFFTPPGRSEGSDGPVGRRWWRSAQWSALGMLGVAIITWAGFRLQFNFAAASLSYLLLIVLQSLTGDFVASGIVSVVALGCLDYYFTSPILSFRVGNPISILALFCFLVTALVITRLVSKVKDKAELSYAQHKKTQQLYEVAQHLLAADPREAAGGHFLEPFRGAFGVRAACLFDAEGNELHVAGESQYDLQQRTRDAFMRGQNDDDVDCGIFVRCIRIAGRTTGAVGFEGLEDAPLTAGPLTALAAALLERSHAVRSANQAAAAAQAESYRSVILDALAHEFKTPLSTILTAAGALREAAALGAEHLEMAETVEAEAARLGRLTTRLIRTARLEQEEIRPWMELTHFASVVADAVNQCSKSSGHHRINVLERCSSTDVLADPDLLRLAISQLLDNACKYSRSGSDVDLIISRQDGHISLRVLSTGAPILASESARIFDRFYRGVDARRMTAGTGLGLYVARKIAIAHGGNLELDSEPTSEDTVAFRMTLPIAESEIDDIRGKL
jgi:two-component system, OmpR family, sensor histidine kinase KdpD